MIFSDGVIALVTGWGTGVNRTVVDPYLILGQVIEAAVTAGTTETWPPHVGLSYLLSGAWLGSEKDEIVGHPHRNNAQPDLMYRG